MAGGGGDDLRDVLSKRKSVIERLQTDPKTKPELVEELECSRATVDRAIKELIAVNCVEPTDATASEFQMTTSGNIAHQEYSEYEAHTDLIATETSVLNALSSDAEIDPAFLLGAEVHVPPDPSRQPNQEAFEQSTRFFGVTPIVYEGYFDSMIQKVRQDEIPVEIIVESELIDSMQETYQSKFRTLLDFDSVSLFEYPDDVPYSLWKMEWQTGNLVGITVYEKGGIRGILMNDSDRAVDWIDAEYERYRDASKEFTGYSEL